MWLFTAKTSGSSVNYLDSVLHQEAPPLRKSFFFCNQVSKSLFRLAFPSLVAKSLTRDLFYIMLKHAMLRYAG